MNRLDTPNEFWLKVYVGVGALVLAILVILAISGCASSVPPSNKVRMPPRCKKTTYKGVHSVVLVSRDCLRPGTSVVTIAVTNLSKPRLATEEATLTMIQHFGFRPRLVLLLVYKAGGIPVYTFVVTGGYASVDGSNQ